MKGGIFAAFAASVGFSLAPALAVECDNAARPIEKMICADRRLAVADTQMSEAYFALLKSVKDKEVHDTLIASQRRWLKARDAVASEMRSGEGEPDNDDESFLSKVTKARAEVLLATGQSGSIAAVERQRKLAAPYTGGRFAGYRTECFFAWPRFGGGYICVGTQSFQHHDRVCTSKIEWASGHETEYRTVVVVVGGRSKTIATCSTGYAETSEQCPSDDASSDREHRRHWDLHPAASEPDQQLLAFPFLKYDPDVFVLDKPWLRACLTEPNYPSAHLRERRSGAEPKYFRGRAKRSRAIAQP